MSRLNNNLENFHHFLHLFSAFLSSIERKHFMFGSSIFSNMISLAMYPPSAVWPPLLKIFAISSAYAIYTQFAQPDIQQVVGGAGICDRIYFITLSIPVKNLIDRNYLYNPFIDLHKSILFLIRRPIIRPQFVPTATDTTCNDLLCYAIRFEYFQYTIHACKIFE